MPKHGVNTEYCSVFGMDAHARSITAKGFDWTTGETKARTFSDCPCAAEIVEWMRSDKESEE